MKFSPHCLKRYKDIGMLLAKYGQPGMASRFNFDTDPEQMNGNGRDAKNLPGDLERLGPTFVKLGQLLSSRADLLPPPYLKALSRLQNRVKPFPYNDVEFIVEQELGTRISKAFGSFEREPLAAASLGQVHCATLHDGRAVVVKVQRPNIHKQIEQDFDALREIATFLQRHTDFGETYQVCRILEEFETTIVHELDYRREAVNLETLAGNLREFPRIRVPLPVQGYTTRRVLTMEYIEGVKITKLSPLARLEMDGGALAEELFQAYLKQVLVDGIFHADPHPGNIFLTPENHIALLDLGMVGHTTPSMQENLLELLLAVSEGSSDEASDIAIRISDTSDHFEEKQFRHKIGQLVAEQQHSRLKEMDLGKVILELGRDAGQTGLFVPMELTLLGKTLLQLDEVGRILAPDFDPSESVRRNARQLLNRRLKSTITEGKIFGSMLEAKQFLSTLPTRMNKIFDTIGNAEINVKVKTMDTEFILESFQKLANRVTTGLVLAALIVGAALLMQVETEFQLFGYPGLAILCFLAAAGGGFWLVINILLRDQPTRRRRKRNGL